MRRWNQGSCKAAGNGPRRAVGSIWQLRLFYTIHRSDLWKRMGNKDSSFFFLPPSSLQFAAKIMWCLDQNWLVPGHFRCSCVGISVVLRHWFSYWMAREGIFIYEMKWLLVPGSFIVQSTTVEWSCSNILRDMQTCALISVLPNVSCQGRIFAIG